MFDMCIVNFYRIHNTFYIFPSMLSHVKQKPFNWLAKIELNHIYQKIFSFAWVWTKDLWGAKLLHWLLGHNTLLNSTYSVSQMPKTKLWTKIKFWISFSVLLSHYLSIEYKLMANSFCWEFKSKAFQNKYSIKDNYWVLNLYASTG